MASKSDVLKANALKVVSRLPRMSPLIGQLLFKSSTSDSSLEQIGDMAEKDPTLAAEFVGMANSGYYARGRRITSVKHAVARIGLGAVRRYALAYSVSRFFGKLKPAPSFPMTLFNLHSTAVGALNEMLCQELPVPNQDSAFASGLFHDFGRLLIAVTAQDQYEAVMTISILGERSMLECEREVLGFDHVELTCMALDPLGVPPDVVNAIAYGHRPLEDPSLNPRYVTMSTILNQADEWVNTLGISVAPRNFKPHEGMLTFPGHEYKREAVLEKFEMELGSLASALGYKGQLVKAPKPGNEMRDVVRELTMTQL